MPRGPRVDFPGAIHHAYARGIEKRDIFVDENDRESFLHRVGMNLTRWGIVCPAWSLMPNHFHLLLQSNNGRLASFMQCLLTGYSTYFNERHGRVGHLFQNRYKTRIVDKVSYLRDIVRYIHLNPVRSGIVPSVIELEEYQWTGHGKILRGGSPEWQDTNLLQEEFHGGNHGWRGTYREYMQNYPTDDMGNIGKGTEQYQPGEEDASPAISQRSYQIFSRILRRLAASHGIPVEEVVGGSRNYQAVQVRRAVLRLCKSELIVSTVQLAHWLGMKENAAAYLLKSEGPGRR